MLQGSLIMVTFVVLAILMMTRKIPGFLAMFLLAVITCIICKIPLFGVNDKGAAIGWIQVVLDAGSTRLAMNIATAIFGAWLGQMMFKTGVSETMIKKSAELGGDRPLVVTLLVMAVTALLFTTLIGLGAWIMIGTIVMPILISIGIPKKVAACFFLMATNIGIRFNLTEWTSFKNILGVEYSDIQHFSTFLLIATSVGSLIFVLVEFRRNGIKFAMSAPIDEDQAIQKRENETIRIDTRPIKGITGMLAMITPVIPVTLVAAFKLPVIPAFLIGIAWITIFTAKNFQRAMNLLAQSVYDGITSVGPTLIYYLFIGMLIIAVTHPKVKETLNPFLGAIIPSNRIPYAIFFALLTPLCLYKGPFNLFGFGSGIAALVMGLGNMSPLAVMGAFVAISTVQGVGDPANTQNVWAAGFVEEDVNALSFKMVPYLWICAVFGVVVSSIIYF
jgi:hypothetical protein